MYLYWYYVFSERSTVLHSTDLQKVNELEENFFSHDEGTECVCVTGKERVTATPDEWCSSQVTTDSTIVPDVMDSTIASDVCSLTYSSETRAPPTQPHMFGFAVHGGDHHRQGLVVITLGTGIHAHLKRLSRPLLNGPFAVSRTTICSLCQVTCLYYVWGFHLRTRTDRCPRNVERSFLYL